MHAAAARLWVSSDTLFRGLALPGYMLSPLRG
jgi:hypothetical protein